MGANKPSWIGAPSWANWLACDWAGSGYSHQGKAGEWYWYAEEPIKSTANPGSWTNHFMTKYESSGVYASSDWAAENWEHSVESRFEKPKPKHQEYEYNQPSATKRITIFLKYDHAINEDDLLATRVAHVIMEALSEADFNGEEIEALVDSATIAIGNAKLKKVAWDNEEDEYIILGE